MQRQAAPMAAVNIRILIGVLPELGCTGGLLGRRHYRSRSGWGSQDGRRRALFLVMPRESGNVGWAKAAKPLCPPDILMKFGGHRRAYGRRSYHRRTPTRSVGYALRALSPPYARFRGR